MVGQSAVVDSIQYAGELGRLDFMSALLACVTMAFIVSAFPLFLYLRGRAATVAKEAVEQQLKDSSEAIEKAAIARMEAMLPTLVADYVKLSQAAVVSGEDADKIAAAQEDASNDDLGGSAESPDKSPRRRSRTSRGPRNTNP